MNSNSKIKNLTTNKLTLQNKGELNNWQNISLSDNYLIIKDNNIQIFEIDLNSNTANFLFEIKVKEELMKIISIDKNNIFFFFSTSIVKFDISTKMLNPVTFCKIINDEKININSNDVTSIYFNEKIKLSFDEKNYYFGLMTVGDEGELLISKEILEDKETGKFEISCESVRSFWKEVKHVELKVFYPRDKGLSKGNFFLTVITNSIGWFTIIPIPDLNDYYSLVDEFKNTNWNILFDMSNIIVNNIFYSFYYDTNYGHPISFIAVTDSLIMKFCEFEENENQEIIIKKETELNFETEIKNSGMDNRGLKLEYLVGTHHYAEIVFVSFKNRIFLYDIYTKEMLTVKKYESEYIRDIYIHDPSTEQERKSFYHLYFLSNRNIYYSKIETNFQNDIYRGNTHNFNFNDSKVEENVLSSRDNDVRYCNVCKIISTKRCAACKLVYYCGVAHQENDWAIHKKKCPWKEEEEEFINTNKIKSDEEVINYSFLWENERSEIISLFKEKDKNPKSFMRGIDLCYTMIQKNRNYILKLNQSTIKNIKNSGGNMGKDKDRENFNKSLINIYKYYEDYSCNILLLIYGFSLKNNKNEVLRIINKMLKETEEHEIFKIIDLITEHLKVNLIKDVYSPKATKNFEQDKDKKVSSQKELQEIFINYLQLISTIAKIYYSLGEFSSYENYMIRYIEKLEKAFQSSPHGAYIISNAYLLMANLYIELDNLGKAIILFNECLNLIPDPKENKEYVDLSIAVNYNLGIVYFITDQYFNSKLKLEQALKIKKDIKGEELTEQTALIYETIGEIEIEYRNFASAFTYLQKAVDIRTKLHNLNDKKSKMKINILLDYIYQNLEQENDAKHQRKASLTSNNSFVTKEQKDFEDLMNYIRSGNEEKNEIYNKRSEKLNKAKFGVDVEELEKFFLFMTKLSSLQIQLLNSTQPNLEKNFKMPIFFSADFKNSLNHHQRLEVNNLKVMSLRRNKVLKKPPFKIEVENLNYDALHTKNTQNNLSSIKNYFLVNKILKNWQITKKYSSSARDEPRFTKIKKLTSMLDDKMSKRESVDVDFNEDKLNELHSIISPDVDGEYLDKKTINKNNFVNSNIKKIDFDQFRTTIRNYCKVNMPSKEETLDDNMLLFLTKKLSNEELETLMESPEFVFEIIEEFENGEQSQEAEEEDEISEKNEGTYRLSNLFLESINNDNHLNLSEEESFEIDITDNKILSSNSGIPKVPSLKKK